MPEPYATSPNVFNVVGIEYNDAECTDPTGNEEVVAGDSPDGFFSGTCYLVGANYALSECFADGTVLSSVFGLDDSTCTGDVYFESATAPAYEDICLPSSENGLYYR